VNFESFSASGGHCPQTPTEFLVSNRSLTPASAKFHVRISIFAAKVPA